MRSLLLIVITLVLWVPARAQEYQSQNHSLWELMPGISLIKYFPGAALNTEGVVYGGPVVWMSPSPSQEFQYTATGLNFSVRCFNEEFRYLAFTFGAGVNWFYDAGRAAVEIVPLAAASGIGVQTK